ncbi:MAG: amino acid ABC transporter substrate-binding protein [Aigarchaeota archaeon]|nr:amino acid ABC transporter substrate-binding protein [Candidatus Pelearchaeum maunauluense]
MNEEEYHKDREQKDNTISRRAAVSRIGTIAVGVVGIAVGAAGGYLAGTQAAPGGITTVTQEKTLERTVTVGGATTVTATETVEKTVTVGGVAESPPRPEILIGISLALAGGYSGFASEQKWAVEEAVKRINGEGGIFLKKYNTKLPVKLVIYNDNSDVTTYVTNIEKLITGDKVDALLGQTGSHFALAIAPVLEKYKVPMVGILGTTEKIWIPPKYNYAFSNFHLARDEVLIYFEFMNSLPADQRPKTIAIWEEASDLGADNANWFEAYAKQFGYEVVLREKYTPGADFTTLVSKTKALNPDVVGSIPSPPDAINMIKVSKELKFSPKLWAFTRGTATGPFGANLKEDAEYVTASFIWNKDLPYEGGLPYTRGKDVVDKYKTETGREPTLLGIHYASAQILFKAIEMAGELDKEKIRDAIQNGEFETVMGRIAFEKGGKMKDSAKLMLIQQWRNGRLEIVWPRELATTDFVYPFPSWEER